MAKRTPEAPDAGPAGRSLGAGGGPEGGRALRGRAAAWLDTPFSPGGTRAPPFADGETEAVSATQRQVEVAERIPWRRRGSQPHGRKIERCEFMGSRGSVRQRGRKDFSYN